jgi:hypothetical protein
MFRSYSVSNKNIFKTKQFKLEGEQFPELEKGGQELELVKEPTHLNFKEASTREHPILAEKNALLLKKGHELFQRNKVSGETTVKKWKDNRVVEESLVEYYQDACDNEKDKLILEHLVKRWELRRDEYDDIHGEGEYEKLYSIDVDSDYEFYDEFVDGIEDELDGE